MQAPSPIYFFYSMLIKLFLHSKIGAIRTNDYFNESFCRQEEGLKKCTIFICRKTRNMTVCIFPYGKVNPNARIYRNELWDCHAFWSCLNTEIYKSSDSRMKSVWMNRFFFFMPSGITENTDVLVRLSGFKPVCLYSYHLFILLALKTIL